MKHFKENILLKKSKYRIIRYIKSRILVILFYVFRIIPIDNKKIVVDSYRGMGYYGNPKYITEALINKKVDCKIIWLSKSYKAITSEKIKVIPFHTIRSVFHLCTANIGLITVEEIIGPEKEINNSIFKHGMEALGPNA